VRTLFDTVELSVHDRLFTETARTWVNIPEITDVSHFVAMPFSCSCSADHGPKKRAPYLGEHTESFLRQGWSPRTKEAAPAPRPARATRSTAPATGAPLQGVTVVELSDVGTVASSACVMLADLGASVLKVEPPQGDCWRTRDSRFFTQLNRGKAPRCLPHASRPRC
jgi:crotonobetainyl-CoA:carnitine CoA-transferase CaiB-like acyl-CoA transferase